MPKKVDLADRLELEIELDIAAPSDALPARAAQRATDVAVDAPAADGTPRRPSGELASGEEAARRMGMIGNVPGMGETIARIVDEAERAGLTHELSDAEAARLAARANARAVPIAAGEPPVYLPAPERVEVANLPALLRRDVANAQGRAVAHPEAGAVVPVWMTLYQAPNYLRQMIRAIGTGTLQCFPCYADHTASARAAGEDPLGSVRFLANINGGPSRKEELDQVAAWVAANGVVVDHTQLTFPAVLPPGYAPRVILAALDDVSYLLVDESVERGAHTNAQYIYAWKGGMDYYRRNGLGLDRVRDLTDQRAVRLQPAEPRGVLPRRAAALPPAAPMPPLVGERVDLQARRKARKEVVERLPVAAPTTPGPSESIRALRSQGFLPFGTPNGPALRKALDDGEIQVSPEKGHSLANSPSLIARRLDATGTVLAEMVYDGCDDLAAQMEAGSLKPF